MIKKILIFLIVLFGIGVSSTYATEPDISGLGTCTTYYDSTNGYNSNTTYFCYYVGATYSSFGTNYNDYNWSLYDSTATLLGTLINGTYQTALGYPFSDYKHRIKVDDNTFLIILSHVENSNGHNNIQSLSYNIGIYGEPFLSISTIAEININIYNNDVINLYSSNSSIGAVMNINTLSGASIGTGTLTSTYSLTGSQFASNTDEYLLGTPSGLTCTTRQMMLPYLDDYRYDNSSGSLSGTGVVLNDTTTGEYMVVYTNSGGSETWSGLKASNMTDFFTSYYQSGATTVSVASSIFSFTEKPYLFFKNYGSGSNFINIQSNNLKLNEYKLFDCSNDDEDRTKPIINIYNNTGNNSYSPNYIGGYTLDMYYNGICVEFNNSWAEYQELQYQFGNKYLKNQETQICSDGSGSYYNGSGTLLCSGSGCDNYGFSGSGIIDLNQNLYPTNTGGLFNLTFIPGIAQAVGTGASCNSYNSDHSFNFVEETGHIDIIFNSEYQIIPNWNLSIVGVNIGAGISSFLNGILSLILGFLINGINLLTDLLIEPLIYGFVSFEPGQSYCFFSKIWTIPNKITETGITHTAVADISDMDILVWGILAIITLVLIFKK